MPSTYDPSEQTHGQSYSANQPTRHRSGWVAGILGGVILVLLAFPPSRYTLLPQLQFALAERSRPLIHALMVRPDRREIGILDRVASSAPDDYLLQVGRATALVAEGGLRSRKHNGQGAAGSDNTLYRLGAVVERFPQVPGAYAHLSRYMMTDRIRLERPELPAASDSRVSDSLSHNPGSRRSGADPGHSDRSRLILEDATSTSTTPDPDDVRMMGWALRAGERRDPDNAFWPAMLATTYFSVHRDEDGKEALRRASTKVRWDAYIYEEVLGEWRLYSAAYGDNGAIQKIGPLSLVSFPHLGEIRKMAQFVRYLAEQAVERGNDTLAIELRHELLLLGIVMRSKAQWAYEALIGTDVCLTAVTDSRARIVPGSIMSVGVWQAQSPNYLSLLKRNNRVVDIIWVRREIDTCCQLRNRIDLARYDASFPGIPPGIPLAPLFGSWMVGVCIIQEILTMLVVFALIRTLETLRRLSNSSNSARRTRKAMLMTLGAAWLASAIAAVSGVPSTRFMLLFLLLSLLDLILAVDAVRVSRTSDPQQSAGNGYAEDSGAGSNRRAAYEVRNWNSITVGVFTALIICPTLLCIGLMWPLLSSQHPVAAALTSMVDVTHNVTTGEALQVALFGAMAPLIALIGLSIPALLRKKPVLPQVYRGLNRLSAPIVGCLALAYVVSLNRTIILDIEASRAISDAARNDLQWVLTHSGDPQGP